MAAEPAAKKAKLWRAVAVMFLISFVLTTSGVVEFVVNGEFSRFALLEIFIGVCGIAVTVVAWLLTFVL